MGRTASVRDPMKTPALNEQDFDWRKSAVSLVSAAFEWSGSESRTEAVLLIMRHSDTIMAA